MASACWSSDADSSRRFSRTSTRPRMVMTSAAWYESGPLNDVVMSSACRSRRSVGIVTAVESGRGEVEQGIGHPRVPLAVDLTIHRQYAPIQRIGNVVMAHVEMGVGQCAQASREIGG